MKNLADNMTIASKSIEDEELVSYILVGLDLDYNPVTSAVAVRVDPISVADLLKQLISFESRFEIYLQGTQGAQSHSSVNAAARGGRGGFGRGGKVALQLQDVARKGATTTMEEIAASVICMVALATPS